MRGTADGFDKSIRRYLKLKKIDELKECVEMIPDGAIIKIGGTEYKRSGSLFDTKVGAGIHSFYPKDVAKMILDNPKVFEGVIFKNAHSIGKQAQRILDAKDYDEVRSILEENHIKMNSKHNVFGTIEDNIEIETCKEVLAGILTVSDEFPLSRMWLNKVRMDIHGDMCYCSSDDAICFTAKYFKRVGGETKIEHYIKQSDNDWEIGKIGWWVKNSSYGSLGVHELTHCILHGIQDWSRGKYHTYAKYCWSVVSSAISAVRKTPYGFDEKTGRKKTNDELRESISGYSLNGKDTGETIAEAMADCYVNKENANPLSIEIKKKLKADYDKLEAQGWKEFLEENKHLWEV